MKGIRVILRLCLLMVLAGGTSLVGQVKSSPWQGMYSYDNNKQVVISGVVQEVRDYKCPVTGTVGSHITVATGTSTIEVHLAPASFMKRYEIAFNKGDRIEIKGARILFDDKPSLLAKQIAVERTTYSFRDEKGNPLW